VPGTDPPGRALLSRGRKRLVRGLLLAGLALFGSLWAVVWTQPAFAFPVVEWLTPGVVWRVETDRPLVGLTFDDGPDPVHTAQVLDILARHGARATFFLIGQRARMRPDLVQRIKTAGHEVANHYFMNKTTFPHSDADFLRYLQQTEDAIGIPGPRKLFRPPGGVAWPDQLRLAREKGYTCVLGSAYPHDPAHPPLGYIRWLVEKNLSPGAIVILHDGIPDPRRSIEALPGILVAGKEKGLTFVPVGELLDAPAR
jgi:peptidoglycan/xylan/chitin deacetylase (PgdA/CDA1 family)